MNQFSIVKAEIVMTFMKLGILPPTSVSAPCAFL